MASAAQARQFCQRRLNASCELPLIAAELAQEVPLSKQCFKNTAYGSPIIACR
jgi:hypothetical protein